MTAKNYLNVYRGARSKANGTFFEEIIKKACDYYRSQRIANIHKENEPMKILKDLGEGKFIACFAAKSEPDFKGPMMNGPSVLFDAKHTDADRLKFSAVTPDQGRSFDEHALFGVECFVLISFGFRKYYKVPWSVFRDMKQIFGRKYIKPEDLSQYEIRFSGGVLLFLEDMRNGKRA